MPKKPLEGDDKVAFIVLRGKAATEWRELLRKEGQTEQHHGVSAIEDYIKAKGYCKEPDSSTKANSQN